jgi:hypothetical protein
MAEEIIFKVGVNTGNTSKDLDNIDKELKSISNTAKDMSNINSRFEELNKKVASGTMTMRESTKAVKEYQTIALQAGKDSPIGAEAIANAARLTDELGDLRNQITNASHDGASMQAALQLGSGIAAGYGAMQGTMALLGSESENLQKTFVKLQAIQSILAGIEQIRAMLEKESFFMMKAKTIATKVQTAAEVVYAAAVGGTTGAMKALRLAMLALPIVAIIAGIVALGAALASFMAEEEKAEAQNEALTKSYERQSEALTRASATRQREIDNLIKIRTAQGASEDELHKLELDRLKESEAARRRTVNMEQMMIAQKSTAYQQAIREDNMELAASIREEIKQHRSKYTDLKALDGQYKVDKQLAEIEFQNQQKQQEEDNAKQVADRQKAANEAAKKRREDDARLRMEREKLLKDLMLASIEDEELQRLMILQESHKRQEQELISKYGKDTELLKQLEITQQTELDALNSELDANRKAAKEASTAEAEKKAQEIFEAEQRNKRAQLEGEMIQMRDDEEAMFLLREELALLERDQALQQKGLTKGEEFKIEQEYQEKVAALKAEQAEKDKQLQKDVMAATSQTINQGLTAIQGLSDAFFANKLSKAQKGSAAELAIEKKKFEVNKKLQIAQAIMQGIQSVQAAYSSGSAIPIVGAVTGPLFAGLAAVQAALNVSKIKNATFEGGGASGALSTASVAPPSIPTPTPNEPTTTATAGLTGSGSESKPTKVFVLDSEITAKQEESAKVNTLSTYGG